MPAGVPGLCGGLDEGQEIGAGMLLRCQTLGAKILDLAISAIYIDGLGRLRGGSWHAGGPVKPPI